MVALVNHIIAATLAQFIVDAQYRILRAGEANRYN